MKYIVFGGDGCTYCKQAVALLGSKGLVYVYKDVYKQEDKDDLLSMMEQCNQPVPRSIPQIFKESDSGLEYIGGFTQLKSSLSEG